jgi:hypothetical protein
MVGGDTRKTIGLWLLTKCYRNVVWWRMSLLLLLRRCAMQSVEIARRFAAKIQLCIVQYIDKGLMNET